MMQLFTIVCIILVALQSSEAYYKYSQRIPNGNNVPHPCSDGAWGGVGHNNPKGGGSRNIFGTDFHDADEEWTPELCRLDSDGDGKTNGEELGDPNCTWKEGDTPAFTAGITHPGVCDPIDSPMCAGKNDFVECNKKSFQESCDAINQPDTKSVDFRFDQVTIPNTETNYYCKYFELPQDQDYHIVADQGIIDNVDVVHHMILYACPDDFKGFPGMDKPGPCSMGGDGESSCGTIVSLWTVGIEGSCFGDNRGFKIGLNGYKTLKLEIHYNNPYLVDDYTDTSGITIFYQPMKAGVQNLATFSVGQSFLQIPPGEKSIDFTGSCEGDCTKFIIQKPMYVISAINHMHYLGIMQKTEVYRDGRRIKVIAVDDPYDYDAPIVHKHEPPFEILPGDEVRTVCRFNSEKNTKMVTYGEGTGDEMCFAFLTIYPEDAIPQTKWCISHGALGTCELYSRTPKYDCDWGKFTNLTNPEMAKWYTALKDNCILDGKCRPGCKAVVDSLLKHPCMGEKMNPIVTNFLGRNELGIRMLAWVRSCQAYVDGGYGHDKVCTKEECWHTCDHGDGDGDWASAATTNTNIRIIAPVSICMALVVFLVNHVLS